MLEMAGRECGAAAAETALREKLFSDVVDGEEVPENKREVFECVVDDILSFAPDRAAAGNFFPRFFQNHKTRHTSHTFRTVQGLLERTILHGEGNSLLVIGPRGSGKTWVRSPFTLSLLGAIIMGWCDRWWSVCFVSCIKTRDAETITSESI